MPNTTRDFVPPAGELACSRSGTPRAADGSESNSRVLQIMLTSIHGRQTRVTFPRWTLEQVGRSSTFVRAVLILAPLICGCSGPSSDKGEADQHVMTFDSSSARFVSHGDTVRLSLELAVSPEQRTMGLMERHHLPENAGMLFLYDSTQPPDAGYWMFRTRIPLDIAIPRFSGSRARHPRDEALRVHAGTGLPIVSAQCALSLCARGKQRVIQSASDHNRQCRDLAPSHS